jgi:hypothetical protein
VPPLPLYILKNPGKA